MDQKTSLNLKYQDYLILAYMKSNYKKYDFSVLVEILGMTYNRLMQSIEALIEMELLVFVETYLVLTKKGEDTLLSKNFDDFFDYDKDDSCKKLENKKLNINEPYVPIDFEL